ncbi:hypothetical protein KFL_000470310 [Klebsormidium nitens]|uniref:Alpha/beta-Hydrolases superfamily protein n=1 Tax=Klebsormidium nitens TaxID=105231 RepID=A0A1Y1HWD9_KLENI|nr:hypothetical protein KFL_000470310 [Klebsormidium nitens]|eukprot:GAQ80158.1 hypothetical protein KFL_000470310 [Klebsormidium nitens]
MAAPSVSQRCALSYGPAVAHAHLSKGCFTKVDPPLVARGRVQIPTLASVQSVSSLRAISTLCKRTCTAGVRARQEPEQFVYRGSAPGAGGVPWSKRADQLRNGRQSFSKAAGTAAPEAQGGSASDEQRTALLTSWLDNEERRNLLALAIDAAFLLQGINSVKGIIANELARQEPKAIAPFIDTAYGGLQQMKTGLKTAIEARTTGRPVQEELLTGFVRHTKELAASVNGLLTKGSDKTEVSEDFLLGLAKFSSGSSAGAGALAVVQNLTEQSGKRASAEAQDMCADYLDALLEGCLGVVQSLLVGLENVRALFEFEAPPPSLLSRFQIQLTRTLPTKLLRTFGREESVSDRKEPPAQGVASLGKPVELPYAVQKVFFATDRVLAGGSPEGVLAYSNKMHDTLETGWTNVSIPSKWEDGSRRKPGEIGKDTDDSSERAAQYHIILLPGQNGTYPSDRVAFYEDLRQETEARGGELLLFIHGFNTSFKGAIRGAAQLAFDLKTDAGSYEGAVLAYDWASYAETLRYGFLPGKGNDDRDRARTSAGRLAGLLRELAASFPGKKLHIVAHSMGNYCLKNALDLLNADPADFRVMVNQLLPLGGSPDAPLVTLFCSRGDWALVVSSVLRFVGVDFGYRAGLFREWLLLRKGHRVHPVLLPGQLDTVDASGFATDGFGHGYFSNNESLLAEISKIINHGKAAQERLHIEPLSLEVQSECEACTNWYKVTKPKPQRA